MEIETKIVKIDGKEYYVSHYPNDVEIKDGDTILFWFGGWMIDKCEGEQSVYECNPPDKPENKDALDLVSTFWRKCYKVFRTNYKVE